MEAIYDTFIAYHGTFDKQGSYGKAKEIADYLTSRGYAVYLHGYKCLQNYPAHKETPWNHTWERVNESKTFLLVVNDNAPIKKSGALGNEEGEVSQICDETDRFCAMVKQGNRDKHDFNIFYCGDLSDEKKFKTFTESLYNPLTDGHNYLLSKRSQETDVEQWLLKRNVLPLSSVNPVAAEKKITYKPHYNSDFVKVVEGNAFSNVYDKACYVAKNRCNNLIIVLDVGKEEFINKYPYEEALKKAKVLMGNKPENPDDKAEIEFSLYHGDYIKFEHEGKSYDGYSYAIEELTEKHTSRRALISLISTTHIYKSGNRQIPSYMLSQLQIQNDTLIITEYFRAMEIKGFLPVNMAETYLLTDKILEKIADIRRVVVTYHVFDAYISDVPKSSLYIPKMDRNGSQYEITAAAARNDYDTILDLLNDKLNSKIYNNYVGFEHLRNSLTYLNKNDGQIKSCLNEVIEKCKRLENLYKKSNDPQDELIKVIGEIILKIIKYFDEVKANGN